MIDVDPTSLAAVMGGSHFMDDLSGLVAVVGFFLLVAWFIKLRHDRSLRRSDTATLGAEERRAMQEMGALAGRMEQRVENLERILDNELSGWRSRMPR